MTQIASSKRELAVLTRSRPSPEVLAVFGEENLQLGDAADPDRLEAALEGVGHVVYCAGGLLPAESEADPELDRRLTLEPVRAVLAALRTRPGVVLTYLSSGGTVYGEPTRLPVKETDATHPTSAYGLLHLACEQEIEQARIENGLSACILRCSTVYGEFQRPDRGQGVIVTFLHRIGRGEPIDLYGDGSTIRDYIYAGDVARVVEDLLDRERVPSLINVGAGEGTSLVDVLRLAEKQVGQTACRSCATPSAASMSTRSSWISAACAPWSTSNRRP